MIAAIQFILTWLRSRYGERLAKPESPKPYDTDPPRPIP